MSHEYTVPCTSPCQRVDLIIPVIVVGIAFPITVALPGRTRSINSLRRPSNWSPIRGILRRQFRTNFLQSITLTNNPFITAKISLTNGLGNRLPFKNDTLNRDITAITINQLQAHHCASFSVNCFLTTVQHSQGTVNFPCYKSRYNEISLNYETS